MTRFFDRGAVTAAFVGVGMAVTMAIGFLLVVPIEPVYVLLSAPGGMVIGYYANARSSRTRGQWRRILPNALVAGAASGLTMAALLLGTKALFFFADGGYPDFNRVDENGTPVGQTCQTGGDCVYRRYLAAEPDQFAQAGITDAASFSELYWTQQWSTARLLVASATLFALVGGGLFGIAGPRRAPPLPARSPAPA
jgi:hypothetical protein